MVFLSPSLFILKADSFVSLPYTSFAYDSCLEAYQKVISKFLTGTLVLKLRSKIY